MDEPRTTLRRSNPLPIVLVVLVAAAALAFFGWRFWQRSRAPEVPAASAPAGPAAPAAPAEAEPPGEAVDPATADALVAAVSPHELYRRAVAEGDLVARAALVVDNLREGASPRRPLAFLAPAKPFTVLERDGRTVIAPASYARYDAFADAVASVDAEKLARAYRAIRGPLAAAYRALGHPDARLDAAVARGLERIEAVAIPEGDVAVRDEEGVYVFEDGRLEALPEVEKHLLRMGPRNGRVLQAKARELRAALALPPSGARPAP
jgi:hypothetical protein